MLAALAGLVHDRQRAESHERTRRRQLLGGLHSGLTPPATHWLNFRPSNTNLQENVWRTQPLLRRTKISNAAFCLPPRENTGAFAGDGKHGSIIPSAGRVRSRNDMGV
jgi:hypothetical protein